MNIEYLHRQLARNMPILEAAFAGLDDDFARRRPEPGKWSLLEILNHLADEEREDFRTRLDYTLHHLGEAWPGIDPEGWVTARKYNERGLAASLEDFRAERRRSLEWLAGMVKSGDRGGRATAAAGGGGGGASSGGAGASSGGGGGEAAQTGAEGGAQNGGGEGGAKTGPPPDLDRSYAHPSLGVLRAGDIAAAWAAHDLLHLQQIARTRIALLKADAEPYSTRYAGA